jgi:hypothetical protein
MRWLDWLFRRGKATPSSGPLKPSPAVSGSPEQASVCGRSAIPCAMSSLDKASPAMPSGFEDVSQRQLSGEMRRFHAESRNTVESALSVGTAPSNDEKGTSDRSAALRVGLQQAAKPVSEETPVASISGLEKEPVKHAISAKVTDFRPSTLTALHTLQGKGQLHCFAASPDGSRAVSGASPMCLWDLRSMTAVKTFFVYKDHQVRKAAISPDGRYGLFGFFDRIHLWELESCSEVFGSSSAGGDDGVVFFPDGARALTATKTFHIWDVQKGEVLRSFGRVDSVRQIIFLDDGKTFLTGGWNCPMGAIRLWDVEKGELVRSFGPAGIHEVACAPGADRVVTSTKNKIELWSLSTGAKLRELSGHAESVNGLAIAPDGKTIASVALMKHSATDPNQKDGTVRLWSADSGNEITREPLSNTGEGVVFLPDNKLLTADLYDLRLWHMSGQGETEPAPATAPQVVRDALTIAEQNANQATRPVETRSCDEAVEALFRSALPVLPTLDKNVIDAAYSSVASSWPSSKELMQGSESTLRPIVEATLRRMAARRDFSAFKVGLVDSAAQVSTFLTNPERFVPLRMWKGANGLCLCGNFAFHPEAMRFEASDVDA